MVNVESVILCVCSSIHIDEDEVERSGAMECVLSVFFFPVDVTSLNVIV